jgi:hypothetical protein
VWGKTNVSLAKVAEALRWRGYYQLLHFWMGYRNVPREGLAAAVKTGVRPLRALMVAHAGGNKCFDGR